MTELATHKGGSNAAASIRERFDLGRISSWVFYLLVTLLLIYGWWIRDEQYLLAESGLGYALGIIGGSMMLALLIYPLRKRVRSLGGMLSVKFWFRTHMAFGVLGPVAILFHSNFGLGSVNSNVALFSMLLVAGSGLVGRYLYVKIHHGLYGSKTRLSEFRDKVESREKPLKRILPQAEDLLAELQKLDKLALSEARNLLHSIHLMRLTASESARLKKMLKTLLRQEKKKGKLSSAMLAAIKQETHAYLEVIRDAAHFRVHERLFALWHVLHLPLFIMLLVAGIVHVVVVHMY